MLQLIKYSLVKRINLLMRKCMLGLPVVLVLRITAKSATKINFIRTITGIPLRPQRVM